MCLKIARMGFAIVLYVAFKAMPNDVKEQSNTFINP